MKVTKDRIEAIKKNGYELDFGTVFEHAFGNYKKIAVYAGSMLLIFSVLFGFLLYGIAVSIFGIATVTHALQPENFKPENLVGDVLLIYTTTIILLTCLISPFQAGFLKMADCAEKGEEFHVSTIFEYYKLPYFGNIFLATFILTLLSSGLSNLLGMAGVQNLSMLTSLAISFFSFLTIPLIVFGKLNAIEGIQSSASIILKQPLLILGLIIISIIGSCIGIFAFCIGVFFTIPLIYSMEYALYNSIINIDSETGIKQ